MILCKITFGVLLGALILADLLILGAVQAQNLSLLIVGTSLLRWPFGVAIYAIPLAFVADIARAIIWGHKPKRT
jgi:hypothetical protein